jgi:hypothetical protein
MVLRSYPRAEQLHPSTGISRQHQNERVQYHVLEREDRFRDHGAQFLQVRRHDKELLQHISAEPRLEIRLDRDATLAGDFRLPF